MSLFEDNLNKYLHFGWFNVYFELIKFISIFTVIKVKCMFHYIYDQFLCVSL